MHWIRNQEGIDSTFTATTLKAKFSEEVDFVKLSIFYQFVKKFFKFLQVVLWFLFYQ